MKRILLLVAALTLLTGASPAHASDFFGFNYGPLGNCTNLSGGNGILAAISWTESRPREFDGNSTVDCRNRTGISFWNLEGRYRYRVTGTQTWQFSTCHQAAHEPYTNSISHDPNALGPAQSLVPDVILGPDASGTQTWDWQLQTAAYYTTSVGNNANAYVSSPTVISNYLPPTSGCGA